jgi:AbiV family abortive infection protein
MGACAASLLSGLEIDQNKLLIAWRRHSFKNKSNAYMLDGPQAEKDAKIRGDWEMAREEFKKFQMEFHEASNDAKNASLYVDWRDGEFVSPSERITPEMLAQIISLSE